MTYQVEVRGSSSSIVLANLNPTVKLTRNNWYVSKRTLDHEEYGSDDDTTPLSSSV